MTCSTISRWIKTVMAEAGIDCTKYKAHSVRAALVSRAASKSVPIEEILKTAGWASARVFSEFYSKLISVQTTTFDSAVLQ